MFICEACRLSRTTNAPSIGVSLGKCEMCNTVANCNDIPSDAVRRLRDMTAITPRYKEMVYKFYNELVGFQLSIVHPPDLDNTFPWDTYVKVCPWLQAQADSFDGRHNYQLSERQCSAAVMAIRAYAMRFLPAPPIDLEKV